MGAALLDIGRAPGRYIGGVIRKFRGNLRIRYAIENGRFWLVSLTEESFDVQAR